jgi:hypothetical protein
LIKPKEAIDMTKKLLIIVLANPVMVMMPSRSSGETKGNHILRSPGKVEPAMKFGEEKGNNDVVNGA